MTRPGGGYTAEQDAAFRQRVDAACARRDLSDIVGRYTTLKKSGRELAGLCPFHQERSPSFQVSDAKGFAHCFGCGWGGDHIRFLMDAGRLSFMDALRDLEEGTYPEVSPAERAERKRRDEAAEADRIMVARRIWEAGVSTKDTPAEVYARSRGIVMPLPDTVRFVMTPRWRNAETGEVGRDLPAMCCALQRPGSDDVVGVQCVFLAHGGRRKYEAVRPNGTKAKAKLSFGAIIGAVFVASRAKPIMAAKPIICEGPEDGLTLAQELEGHQIWVACGTGLMPQIEVPPSITGVVLAGDNNEAGRAAARRAETAFVDRGLTVATMWPDAAFKDWNDQLRGVRA